MHGAKAEGKPVSRYISTRNKKSLNTPNRLEKRKVQPASQAAHASSGDEVRKRAAH
jgi:hypothetical protein